MPIRSPRRLYLINSIEVNIDDDPDVIDRLPGDTTPQTKRPIVVKMKEGIGEYLGLVPLAYNDPILTGVFQGSGLNQGAEFRKKLGGFKQGSYMLLPETIFTIQEKFYDNDNTLQTPITNFKSMSIGFPTGHTVKSVIDWLSTLDNFENIRAIRSPRGALTDLYSPV